MCLVAYSGEAVDGETRHCKICEGDEPYTNRIQLDSAQTVIVRSGELVITVGELAAVALSETVRPQWRSLRW